MPEMGSGLSSMAKHSLSIPIMKSLYYPQFSFRGAEANTSCVFPFQYGEGGMTHYGCVTYGYEVLL